MSTVMAAGLTVPTDICSTSNAPGAQPLQPRMPSHGHCTYCVYCTMCQAFVLDLPDSLPSPYQAKLRYVTAGPTPLLTVIALRYADPWTRAPPG